MIIGHHTIIIIYINMTHLDPNSKQLSIQIIDDKNTLQKQNMYVFWEHVFLNIKKLIQRLKLQMKEGRINIEKISILNNDKIYSTENIESKSHVFMWVRRLIYSKEPLVYFVNIPFFISTLLVDIKNNINRRTIYLYQTIILLTLPILIYNINKKFCIISNNNVLRYIAYNQKENRKLSFRLIPKVASKDTLISTKILYPIDIDSHLDFKNNIRNEEPLKEIKLNKKAQEYLYIRSSENNKILHKKPLLECGDMILKNSISDNKRMYQAFSAIFFRDYKSLYNVNIALKDEWVLKETLLNYVCSLNINNNTNNTFSKERDAYIIEKTRTPNISYLLNKLYSSFIAPNYTKDWRFHTLQDINQYEKNKPLEDISSNNLIDYNQTLRKEPYLLKCSNDRDKQKTHSISIKEGPSLKIFGHISEIPGINISESTKNKIDRLDLDLSILYKSKVNVITKIPSWLSKKDNMLMVNNISLSKNDKQYKKCKIYSFLLDNTRRKWRYKILELIKTNPSAFQLPLSQELHNNLYFLLDKKPKLHIIFDLYWQYPREALLKPLIKNIDIYIEEKGFNKTNYLLKKKSCWSSLNLDVHNRIHTLENMNINGGNFEYLQHQQMRRNYILNFNDIQKTNQLADAINQVNNIKRLHFLPIRNFAQPFLYLTNRSEIKMDRIFYSSIIEYSCITHENIKKTTRPNPIIQRICSKIDQTIKANTPINILQENNYRTDVIEYFYQSIGDSKKNILLSTKDQENLFVYQNIKIGKVYKKNKCHNEYVLSRFKLDKINPAEEESIATLKSNDGTLLNRFSESNIRSRFWLLNSLLEPITIDLKEILNNQTQYVNNIRKDTNRYRNNISVADKFNIIEKELKPSLVQRNSTPIKNRIQNNQILAKYNKWILTSPWWLLTKKIMSQKIARITENLYDINHSILQPHIQNMLSKLPINIMTHDPHMGSYLNRSIAYELQQNNKILLEEIYKSTQTDISIPYRSAFLNTLNSKEWVYVGWLITLCIIYYHWISILTGTQYIYMWYNFEKMRSLSHPSSNTFLNILIHNSIKSPAEQLRLTMYASRGWITWIKSKIYLYLAEHTFLYNNFFNTKGIDIPRRNKNLVVNSLITEKKLLSQYKLWNPNKEIHQKNIIFSGYETNEGMNFLEKWSRRYSRDRTLIRFNRDFSRQSEWLNDLFFHMEGSPYKVKLKTIEGERQTRILSEPISLTRRWLLIGELESGKSYIIKQIAANTNLPLIHISLKGIRHATPDIKYNNLKKYNKWIKQLADRAFLLLNILELATILSPCIFWISDLHEFHTTHHTENQKGKIYDASLLLTILLKMMGSDLLPENKSNITFIGSTDSPTLLDPKFVSRHRLDLIVNLRKRSFYQRQEFLTNLLSTKNISVKTKRAFHELGSHTIGYSVRDISSLVNEIFLINVKKSQHVLATDIIRLAVYRQISKQSANNSILECETIHYKIGKAIVQSTLVFSKPLLPITKRHDLWKSRFFYLSNAFLEFSIDKSTVTELAIFTHILNCLSGSAARDAWLLSRKNLHTESLTISQQIKHDFYIASNMLQSLLFEFPMRETSKLNNQNKYQRISHISQKYSIYIMQKTFYSLNFFKRFTSYIYWSCRIVRLSLNWTLLFDSIKKSQKDRKFNSFDAIKKEASYSIRSAQNMDKHSPYERRITKRQEKRAQKLNDRLNETLIENNLKTMGLPWISEYVMHYDALQLSILLLETRPLWNPPTLAPSYSVLFFDRDLLINRNTLTKLYITYGEKFQSEKLNPKRIKKQVLWSDTATQNRNFYENSSNVDTNILLNLDNFHYFQQMARTNSHLEQIQLQPPVYLYQSWTSPDYGQNIGYFDLLNYRASLDNDFLKYREVLIYGILLEVYHCLLNFFIKNQEVLEKIEDALLTSGSLNREYIESTLKQTRLV
jgi:ATPase family associated with various cellular activities (AAA)